MKLKTWMGNKRITIKDVAKYTNLAPSTIHRIKQKTGRVSKEVAKVIVAYTNGVVKPKDIETRSAWNYDDYLDMGIKPPKELIPKKLPPIKKRSSKKKDSKKKKR